MENNVKMHINMFGNTRNIVQNEAHISLDRLERIMDMLNKNKGKIDTANDLLTDPNSFVRVFHYEYEYRNRLKFYHQVRARLIGMWNKELNKLKL